MAPAARFSPIEEENLILDAAAKCIRNSSLLDFKMSEIAAEAGISMGSVYKHVRSKEDVLIALATRVITHSQVVMCKLMALPLSAPERLICTTLFNPIKIQSETFAIHLEMMISNQALLQRSSPRWLEKLTMLDHSMQQIFIDSLLYDKDLLAEGAKRAELIEELMVGLWSMHVGFLQVVLHRSALHFGEPAKDLPFPLDLDHSLVRNAKLLINAYPWAKPLKKSGMRKALNELEKLGYR
jgi:AcrR family transcriptional regulator